MIKLVNCTQCNIEAPIGDLYCRSCGTKHQLDGDYFECECGAPVRNNDKFCHGCGTEFEGEVEVAECEDCGGLLDEGDEFCPNCDEPDDEPGEEPNVDNLNPQDNLQPSQPQQQFQSQL